MMMKRSRIVARRRSLLSSPDKHAGPEAETTTEMMGPFDGKALALKQATESRVAEEADVVSLHGEVFVERGYCEKKILDDPVIGSGES
jgi:hypothetical protein